MKQFLRSALSITLVASTLFVAACQNTTGQQDSPLSKQNIGTVGGAVIGGVLGSQVGGGKGQLWATGVGTLLGAYLGSEIGKSLDTADRSAMGRAETQAQNAPLNKQIAWNNPQSGNSGTITPVRDGTSADGSYCREFQQTIKVGGRNETAYGTACRQADGTWKIVE